MEKVEYKVAVHKSSVTLMNGESVHSFTNALRTAGTEKLKLALNLTQKTDCYMAEVFGSTAVFDVYKYDLPSGQRQKYYAVSYSRDAKGVFSFGDVVEVQRKTVYETVSPLTKEAQLPEIEPGWQVTGKSFWNGAI